MATASLNTGGELSILYISCSVRVVTDERGGREELELTEEGAELVELSTSLELPCRPLGYKRERSCCIE